MTRWRSKETAGTSEPVNNAGQWLVEVSEVSKKFVTQRSLLGRPLSECAAVDSVSFRIRRGETLGLVGESGCGKSTLGRLLVGLQTPSSGSIHFEGKEIRNLGRRSVRRLRRDMQMIFQDPLGSLDPHYDATRCIAEPLRAVSRGRARRDLGVEVADLLSRVGLGPEMASRRPREMSGGQRQRVGIARAIALHPKLIIADEPVSALDVSVQAQVINLLTDLQREFDLTYFFIAHGLGAIRHICDRVMVMYLGKIVEIADSADLFSRPAHPYTQALVSAALATDVGSDGGVVAVLEGEVESRSQIPSGCRFRLRCPYSQERCASEEPELDEMPRGRSVACHFSTRAVSRVNAPSVEAYPLKCLFPSGDRDLKVSCFRRPLASVEWGKKFNRARNSACSIRKERN